MFIAQQLPSPKATTGRPAYSNQELLPGILRVLRSGCRWRDLNLPGYPDGSTHWRRLRLWRKGLHFRWLWKRILKLLDEQNPQEKELRFKRLSIDGTLLQSFAFREKTGYSGKHKRVGIKASIAVDATGLPLSVVIAKGNAADIWLPGRIGEIFGASVSPGLKDVMSPLLDPRAHLTRNLRFGNNALRDNAFQGEPAYASV
jgi:transposase